ncbi:hypothetical protein [Hoeflea poritis]|uniref:Uncharacterized protein n=1 Tax=Hoeflea poritis TaxID=2993659 RepID=A0ABT4VUV8_9HYPH|nr:hypothetical protein [Hoeflea poritis]MDA4848496.1 hypothetical protein [Hoeflea poritis]
MLVDDFIASSPKMTCGQNQIRNRPGAIAESAMWCGQIIGQARLDIAPGEHVHVRNLGMTGHIQHHALASLNTLLADIPDVCLLWRYVTKFCEKAGAMTIKRRRQILSFRYLFRRWFQ